MRILLLLLLYLGVLNFGLGHLKLPVTGLDGPPTTQTKQHPWCNVGPCVSLHLNIKRPYPRSYLVSFVSLHSCLSVGNHAGIIVRAFSVKSRIWQHDRVVDLMEK